jgi:hypothetical protein
MDQSEKAASEMTANLHAISTLRVFTRADGVTDFASF